MGNVSVKKHKNVWAPPLVSCLNYGEQFQIKDGQMLAWYCLK